MAAAVETMAYAGKLPWHGLGTRVPADLTPEQMLVSAGLDWEVEKLDIHATTSEGDKILIPDQKALVRSTDGTLLDIVGNGWHPLQNRQAFDFFHEFVTVGDMEMHTAGSLQDGQRVWALAKVNDGFTLFKHDEVEQYLLLSNPHKYGECIDVRMSPIRVVCMNTLTMALSRKNDRMVQINHRHAFDPDMVKETLGVAKEKLKAYKEAAMFLAKKKYTHETLSQYVSRVFPMTSVSTKGKTVSRNAIRAMEVVNTQPGAEYGPGTWWQAFNSVTYMTDHILGRSADTRMNSTWYGTNRTLKEGALKMALEMADAA